MNSNNILTVDNIHKSFDKHKVLNAVSFSLSRGKTLAILGRSGSGKSVLLKTICGLLSPDEGNILINNDNMHGCKQNVKHNILNKIGLMFQNCALFDSLPIWENITFKLLHDRTSKSKAKQYAMELIEKVHLPSNVYKQYPFELSGGMQKRVALARTIATKPELIMFDEPTSGLDPITSHTIGKLISDIRGDSSYLIITHNIKFATTFADEIILLYNGEIHWFGNSKEIYTTNNEIVQSFIQSI